jgi:secernin
MCDTMVALSNSTKDGSVIFGKNSDRDPNEPHIIIRIPRQKHGSGEKVKCTYIGIDQVPETNEVLLLKPSWIWGCEMGANDFGLNIGNEAVFTKEPLGTESLTGMDLVRLALERCSTSEQALDLMVDLLDRHGQGGNCGYTEPFTYHNSFLIADTASAWVLETAGQYWAAQKVKDVRSISNCLTIRKDFERAHPQLIEHAVDKKWCKGLDDFDFAACYSDAKVTRTSGAVNRLRTSASGLLQNKGGITVDTVKTLLRSHAHDCSGRQFEKGSSRSICMHAGGPVHSSTTGSYVAHLRPGCHTYWVTGASTPCLSTFKPLWLIEREPLTFPQSGEDQAIRYWTKREAVHRAVLHNTVTELPEILRKRDEIECNMLAIVDELCSRPYNADKMLEVMSHAMTSEEQLIEHVLSSSHGKKPMLSGGRRFKDYWQKHAALLGGQGIWNHPACSARGKKPPTGVAS